MKLNFKYFWVFYFFIYFYGVDKASRNVCSTFDKLDLIRGLVDDVSIVQKILQSITVYHNRGAIKVFQRLLQLQAKYTFYNSLSAA